MLNHSILSGNLISLSYPFWGLPSLIWDDLLYSYLDHCWTVFWYHPEKPGLGLVILNHILIILISYIIIVCSKPL